MLAGIVVENEGGPAGGGVGFPQVVDEWTGEGDGFAIAWELLVHESFEVGFGDESVFGRGSREESVFHLVQMHVSARITVLQDAVAIADELLG